MICDQDIPIDNKLRAIVKPLDNSPSARASALPLAIPLAIPFFSPST